MEHTTPADYRLVMLCPLSPRRTVDPISPFGRSLAQSLDSEGLTTLQVEWSDDLVDVCAARDIERLALVQFERWKMGVRGTRTTDYTHLDLPPHSGFYHMLITATHPASRYDIIYPLDKPPRVDDQ